MYICTFKICGKYLAVNSYFFEFARLTLWLTLVGGNVCGGSVCGGEVCVCGEWLGGGVSGGQGGGDLCVCLGMGGREARNNL